MPTLNVVLLSTALGCAVAPAGGSSSSPALEDPLPPATAAITIDGGSLGVTLAEVMNAFAESTGQVLVIDSGRFFH